MFREDYIHRLIRQLAEAIARITGLRKAGRYQETLDACERAWGDLLDVPRELVDVTDTPTLAGMLRDPERMRVAAQLLTEEGHALEGKGDPLTAALRFRKALELVLEARAMAPGPDDDNAVLELGRRVPANTIDARYRT